MTNARPESAAAPCSSTEEKRLGVEETAGEKAAAAAALEEEGREARGRSCVLEREEKREGIGRKKKKVEREKKANKRTRSHHRHAAVGGARPSKNSDRALDSGRYATYLTVRGLPRGRLAAEATGSAPARLAAPLEVIDVRIFGFQFQKGRALELFFS